MERLSNLPKVTKLGNGPAPQSVFLIPALYASQCGVKTVAQWPALSTHSILALILPPFC